MTLHKTLFVELGERRYPLYIGWGLLQDATLLRPHVRAGQVMIVSSEPVARRYLAPLQAAFSGYQCDSLWVSDREQDKTLATMERILDALASRQHHRTTCVVALGGGVIGDMAGFAAACYQRGVACLQVPTTLLAQVDASVGGKVGVNHPRGRNLLGAFHQPECVVMDIDTLASLADRDLVSGLGEVIKAAVIRDEAFFYWLEGNMERLLARDPATLAYAVEQACLVKIKIIEADERESDLRSVLNFGHTFGHALEHQLGYGRWRHGEAVAVGMALAADVSERLGWVGHEVVTRIETLLDRAGLPRRLPSEIDIDGMLADMALDKKIRAGKLRYVLLRGLGRAEITTQVAQEVVRDALERSAQDARRGSNKERD